MHRAIAEREIRPAGVQAPKVEHIALIANLSRPESVCSRQRASWAETIFLSWTP